MCRKKRRCRCRARCWRLHALVAVFFKAMAAFAVVERVIAFAVRLPPRVCGAVKVVLTDFHAFVTVLLEAVSAFAVVKGIITFSVFLPERVGRAVKVVLTDFYALVAFDLVTFAAHHTS